MIRDQYVGLKNRAQRQFEEFAKYHSPISMAASPETGTMLWFLLQALEPDLVIETGSGYTTAIIAEWLQDKATTATNELPSVQDERPRVYHVEEFQEWEHRVLSYLKRVNLEPGVFVDYPDLYCLNLDTPFFALLDGLRSERPVVVRHLVESGAASRSVLLIDDAQTDTNEDVQESLDLLDLSNQGFLYDLAPWTLDSYGRWARLFIGYQSRFKAHLLYEMDLLRSDFEEHRILPQESSPVSEANDNETATLLPVISIVITCYNQAAYIQEAIESALEQTYPNTEIIVVNDGSSDESLATINQVFAKFPNKITVIAQENQGVSKTRDAGVNAASGKYVVPLDGDDVLMPTALQTWFDFAQNHPEYSVIYSNAIRFDEGGCVTSAHIPRQQRLKVEGNILSSLLGWGVVTSCALIKREEILKVGGYSFALTLKGHDDFFLYVRLLLAGCKFAYMDHVSLLYRDREHSISKSVERGNQFKYAALQYAYEHNIDQMVSAAQELTTLGLAEHRERELQRLSLRQTQREHAKTVEPLESEQQNLSHQTPELEQYLAVEQDTRAKNAAAGWWAFRSRLVRGGVPRSRAQQLLRTSHTLIVTEGPSGFMRRLKKWLSGERRYYHPNASAPSVSLDTSSKAWSPSQLSGRSSREATVSQILRTHYSSLEALNVYPSSVPNRRLNIVTDTINSGSLFGGVATSLLLGAMLSRKWGAPLRVITRTEKANTRNFSAILNENAIAYDANVEFIFADQHDLDASVSIGEGDIFLTTSWWTTEAVRRTVTADRILYLLQEDERTFYPFGDERVRCVNVLSDPDMTFILNSKLLYDHFLEERFVNIVHKGMWFEPSWSSDLFFREERLDKREPRNLFFYSRPDHVRNLFYLGIESLDTALKRGIIQADDWHFHFVGKNVPDLHFDEPVQLSRHEGLSWVDYAALVRKMDLGLSLMASPHPSYPPIDLAACGAVVVTNRYGTKQSLNLYSENILCCDLTVEGLVQGMMDAQTLLRDPQRVMRQYKESRLLRNWEISFNSVLEKLDTFGLQVNA